MKRCSINVLAGISMMIVSTSSVVGQEKSNILFGGKDYTVQLAFAEKYQSEIDAFAKDYMDFLGTCKTVRESVAYFEARAKQDGFVNWDQFYELGKTPKTGDRFYFNKWKKIFSLPRSNWCLPPNRGLSGWTGRSSEALGRMTKFAPMRSTAR